MAFKDLFFYITTIILIILAIPPFHKYIKTEKIGFRDVADYFASLEPVFFPLMMVLLGLFGFYYRFWLSDEPFTFWETIKFSVSVIIFLISLFFLIVGQVERRREMAIKELDSGANLSLAEIRGLSEENLNEIKNFIEFTLSKNKK